MNEGKAVATHPGPVTSLDIPSEAHSPPVLEYLDLESSSPKSYEYNNHEKVEEDEEDYISPLAALSTISSHTEVDSDVDLETTETSRPKFLQPLPSAYYDPCKPLLGSIISPDEDVLPALENAKHPDQYTVVAIPGVPHSIHSRISIERPTPRSTSPASTPGTPGIVPSLNVEYVDYIGGSSARNTPSTGRNSSYSSSSSSTSMDSLSIEPVDEAVLNSASCAGSSLDAQISNVPPPVYDSADESSENIASPDSPTTVKAAIIRSKRFSIPRVPMSPPLGLEDYEVLPLHRQDRHPTPDHLLSSEGISSGSKAGLFNELRKFAHKRNKSVGHPPSDNHTLDAGTSGEPSTDLKHPHDHPDRGRHRLHKEPPRHTT